jgi:hypothetical protein
MNEHEIERIAGAMNHLRPDWPIKQLRTLLADPRIAGRPRRDVVIALGYVACESNSASPYRVIESGPWWQSVTAGDGPQTNHPPKRDETCPRHPAYRATNCGGCLADQRAADGGDTPPRAWEPAESNAAALARAAFAQSRAQLCAHGVPRLNCADHRDTHPTEETRP